METPFFCPVCGANIPPNARACPACGADEETGWSDRTDTQRLGIPDDEFDYEEYVREEFGPAESNPLRTRGISWFWWLAALLVAGAFLAMYWRF